jgi:hypothetical protein
MDEQVVRLCELPVAELADEPLFWLGKGHSLMLLLKQMLKNKK